MRKGNPVKLEAALVACACVLALACSGAQAVVPRDRAVLVSATVALSPPQVRLVWPADPSASGYTVYRKAVEETAWQTGVALNAGATGFTDAAVDVGQAYEYRIVKSAPTYQGFGYAWVGVQAPLRDNRGILILIVDNTHAADLAGELARLEQDLVGDGWMVKRHDVARNSSVLDVKALIQADYAADPDNTKAVFLFGHVPVPYSGNIAPDGHGDHAGAWPADVFYADIDGVWTDNTVNTTSASRPQNRNVPGDGKWDQSSLPSDVELQIGRVDLFNLPAFLPKTEKDLLRQYLNKNHRFRHRQITAQRRALIDDNFGDFNGEAFAVNGWRNFAPFFHPANIVASDWFGTLGTQSYLWAYGCGGGSYTSAGGVGDTGQFASTDTQAVFTMLFGSYFGDWDVSNSFLRAPLATTTYGLTCAWAGRPHWFLHHMALGETIGYSTRVSQNNAYNGLYQPQNFGTRSVHVALMGDPTLRMHPVTPPSDFAARPRLGGVNLTWTASPDATAGYLVYRAWAADGPFQRLTDAPIGGTRFIDDTAGGAIPTYMVRAVHLETTPSGSYFNPSQGVFARAPLRGKTGGSGTQ